MGRGLCGIGAAGGFGIINNMKKILLLPVIVIPFLTSCSANVLVRRAPMPGKTMRVAILPFKPNPLYPVSGELAYEAFSASILEVKGYTAVDRGAVDQIVKEQKLTQSGVFDQEKAIEIGKLLGAEGIILGTVTEYTPRKFLMFPPAKVSLAARLVNTQTGEVEWTATQTKGGLARWLTWIFWPAGVYATITSPSVEDQVQKTGRSIFRALEKKIANDEKKQ